MSRSLPNVGGQWRVMRTRRCGPSRVRLVSVVLVGTALGGVLTLDLGPDRIDVGRDREPKGSSQCPPAYGEVETGRVGVQPGTTSGDARPRVGDENRPRP